MKSYQENGISHLFAVSGMHVSLFTSILLLFLKKITKSNFVIYFIIFIFLITYTFLTNFSPSIIRASTLFILVIINRYLYLNIKNDYLLLYILSCSLIYNPFYIYNNGFLFSYIISYFLIKFGYIINNYNNYMSKLLITSFISFLASLPILINSYFSINFLTPFYNLLFVPLVSLIIFPLSLLTFLFPFLDNFYLCLIQLMEKLSLFFNTCPIGNVTLSHLPSYFLFGYYYFIIFIINKLKIKEYKYIVGLIIIIFFHHNIRFFDRYPTLSVINVGQGDAIILTLPHNKGNILIDCANIRQYNDANWKKKKEYNVGESVIVPYLKAQGINNLDYAIMTHGDYDHIGSLDVVMDEIKIKKVIFNSGSIDYNEQKVIDKLKRKKIKYQHLSQNVMKIDKYYLYFLNDIDKNNENEDSLVIYTILNGYKILLMGDAGFPTEEYLINAYNIQNVDILKVGHHGSKYSTSSKFITKINPKISLISVGVNNKFGHPSPSVLENLANSRTYLTSINGSIKIILKPSILVQSVR